VAAPQKRPGSPALGVAARRLASLVSPGAWAWDSAVAHALSRGTAAPIALASPLMSITPSPPCSAALGACERAQTRRPLGQVPPSRHQWKAQAKQRSDHHRYLRQPLARGKAARAQATPDRKAPPSRLRQLESQAPAVAARAKVAVVGLCRPRCCAGRLSLRAVCRVLRRLAPELGLKKAPGPHTVSHWGIRRASVRLEAARGRRGFPLRPAPCSNGLSWMSARSMGRGAGKIVAV
jgi:hypothetical protein